MRVAGLALLCLAALVGCGSDALVQGDPGLGFEGAECAPNGGAACDVDDPSARRQLRCVDGHFTFFQLCAAGCRVELDEEGFPWVFCGS